MADRSAPSALLRANPVIAVLRAAAATHYDPWSTPLPRISTAWVARAAAASRSAGSSAGGRRQAVQGR
ncbi:MAG: hypothetical protein ABWX59_07385 [Microbacteriaceae bacterium]